MHLSVGIWVYFLSMSSKDAIWTFVCKTWHMLSFTSVLYFFKWLQVTLKYPFTSTRRTPFSISFKAGLLETTSLYCCLSGNVLISLSFLKGSFSGYIVLMWQLFFFLTFKYAIPVYSDRHIFLSFFFGCTACGIIVPRPGIEPGPSAVRAQSPNPWTTREFP